MAKKKTTKKTTKKKKTKKVSKAQQQLNKIKAEALKKIVEHNRDYLKLDITLPLGDTALKNVHTNQWLFTNLPSEFELVNWTIIAKQLNSNVNRYEGYVKNRWYIDSVTVDVDASGKAEMKLGLNAFASSLSKFADDFRSAEEAYTNATTKKTTSATKNTTNAVTTGDNDTIKNGWWGDWVTKKVAEFVGSETDTLAKCKKAYQGFHDHALYHLYCDAPRTKNGVDTYEKAWNENNLNCGDGANILCAFFECCGASSSIYLAPGHYVVRCTVNGTDYWCDQSGGEGAHNLRGWNETYGGYRGGSEIGKRITYGTGDCG
jgi:hypothetical protein